MVETSADQGHAEWWVSSYDGFHRYGKTHLQWFRCVYQILCKTWADSDVDSGAQIAVVWQSHQPVCRKQETDRE